MPSTAPSASHLGMHTGPADANPSVGTIYGVLLNDAATLVRMGDTLQRAPYKAPPRAPVMYIKTRNTRATQGARVAVPAESDAVSVGGTLGLVLGRSASRLSPAHAMAHVRGLVIASDLCLPHDSVFRPAVRLRCRDGFCPMSEEFALACLPEPDQARISIAVDGKTVHQRTLATLVRSLPQLLADVTEFMTLAEGDVLLIGPPEAAPLARVGQQVQVTVSGLGTLSHQLVHETLAETQP